MLCYRYDRNILSEDFMPEFYEWFYFTVQLPPPHPPRPLSAHIIDAQKWEENIQMSGRKMGYFFAYEEGEQHFCCNIFSLKVCIMKFLY